MLETAEELSRLDEMLTGSVARSSEHLRSIVTPGERTLNAAQLVSVLKGICHLSVATVTAKGEPRISAVDGHFLHGRFVFTTTEHARKVRHLRARPAVSASHLQGDALGVFVHGTVEFIIRGHREERMLDEYVTTVYGTSPYTFGDEIVFIRINPAWMIAYAFEPNVLLGAVEP